MTEDVDLLHQMPTREMSAHDMHVELHKKCHRQCFLTTCRMKQHCWQGLREMKHNPDNPKKCEACLVGDYGRHDYLAAVRIGK
ncbi:hypothetical protein [Nocardia jiangxiensis]|uniref:hypothetical protein n=1 Tax=Nocardia jiangxiensis TaxID=282685 RepID=UPI0012F62204|nr:hypothetical protein [Nocardia jiangxiensis]